MITVGSFEAKTKLAELLDKVEQGEVVTITRRGKTVARPGGARKACRARHHDRRTREGGAPLLMALVLDCSVALSWFFPDEKSAFTEAALDLAALEECWVPAIWRLEFPNALLVAERKRRLTRDERLQVLDEAAR